MRGQPERLEGNLNHRLKEMVSKSLREPKCEANSSHNRVQKTEESGNDNSSISDY